MQSDFDQHHRHEPSQTGRDELNLIDFPIGTLSYKQPLDDSGRRPEELEFSVNTYDDDVGVAVPKKLTIRTSSQHGFPTPKEEQLLVGLLLLTRLKNNFTDPRVEFRPGELFRLMNWPHNGSSKRQLQTGLDRLCGVKLKYENSWQTEGEDYAKVFHTGVLDSYQLTTAKGDHHERTNSWILWSAKVYADIRSGNVKELNTDDFFSLKLPLARRLYRFLDKHLSTDPTFQMDLISFASHIGISEKSHIGKIKERLKRPVEELQQLRGFIDSVQWTDRFARKGVGQWLITFSRQPAGAKSQKPRFTARVEPQSTDATAIVTGFYQQWTGAESNRLTQRELQQADDLISEYSTEDLQKMLPLVVKEMKRHFPDARAFGATLRFWPDAAKKLKRIDRQPVTAEITVDSKPADDVVNQEKAARRQRLRTAWQQLSETEQKAILKTVEANANAFVKSRFEQHGFDDTLVELACFDELEARRNRQNN